jgi:MftR C-terminal domain
MPDGRVSFGVRLVRETPALAARLLAKQCGWRPLLAAELAERNATGDPGAIRPTVLAAAAIDCLSVAINRWADNNGQPISPRSWTRPSMPSRVP